MVRTPRPRPTTPRPTAAKGPDPTPLDAVFAGAELVVTCGTGGVGKTTIAAALAIHLAIGGQRVGLMTIDPAKRLADALGLDGLTNDPSPVELPRHAVGSLHACMLDTAATFDDVVRRHASGTAQVERILANAFYRNIANNLGGTQEYMAGEKVQTLRTSGAFDVLVIDTPPSRNALDFMTAPARLVRLLDNKVFRLMIAPARGGLRILGGATQTLLRAFGKVIGGDVLADAVEFFQAFEGMEQGFAARATEVMGALRGERARWVLVTTPSADAIVESAWFISEMASLGLGVDAVIGNRLTPFFGEPAPRNRRSGPANAAATADLEAVRELNQVARSQRSMLELLSGAVPDAVMVLVPARPGPLATIDDIDLLLRSPSPDSSR